MNLVYVTHNRIVTGRYALIVADEADLKVLLAEREAAFKAEEWKPKIDRDKSGNISFNELNAGWPEGWRSSYIWKPTDK